VSARATVVLLVAFAAFSGTALWIDRSTTPTGQLLVSVVAWLFLGAALLTQSVPIRRQVLALVAIATILECIGSLVWGAYIYRLANLPLYVPAGHGRYPLLYAVSFAMTTALELYGTSLGIWRWSPVLPALMLPAGNPPTGIGAGYAAMDALTRRIVGRAERAWASRSRARRADGAALPIASARGSEAPAD